MKYFVEFLIPNNIATDSLALIRNVDKEFVLISDHLIAHDQSMHRLFTGKIDSTAAVVLKLSYSSISKHMRISYISDDLKNKYRNG